MTCGVMTQRNQRHQHRANHRIEGILPLLARAKARGRACQEFLRDAVLAERWEQQFAPSADARLSDLSRPREQEERVRSIGEQRVRALRRTKKPLGRRRLIPEDPPRHMAVLLPFSGARRASCVHPMLEFAKKGRRQEIRWGSSLVSVNPRIATPSPRPSPRGRGVIDWLHVAEASPQEPLRSQQPHQRQQVVPAIPQRPVLRPPYLHHRRLQQRHLRQPVQR